MNFAILLIYIKEVLQGSKRLSIDKILQTVLQNKDIKTEVRNRCEGYFMKW